MDKPLIMVVDDDTVVANSISNTIRDMEKYEVITAYSAREALEHLAKGKIFLGLGGNRIKLIFLDIKMPEMDGLQFLERIRKDYGPDIGVTMLTAYEDEEKWERATDGYIINYIKKPCDEKELTETIDDFFAGKGTNMTLKTFEKHMDKMDEWKKGKSPEGGTSGPA